MRMRYKILLSIIVVLILMTSSLSVSYGVWTLSQEQENDNTYTVTSCFQLNFNEESESINLRNTYPMSDIRGSQTSPYIFNVTNTCNHPISYKVVLNTLNSSTEFSDLEMLSDQYIRISLGGNASVIATDLNTFTTIVNPNVTNTSNSYVIYSDTLEANESSNNYSLRLWVKDTDDGSVTNPDGSISYGTNVMNKVFEAKLSIEANSSY